MRKFEMDGPIIMNSNEDIAAELEAIAKSIREGSNSGPIESDLQCLYWEINDDDSEDYS